MTKDIDAAMNSIPPGWRSRWCNSTMCACMGCANKSGGLTAKGYTYQDWINWVSRNQEDYMNGLSPIKEVKWNEATEMTVEELQSKNCYVNMSEMRHFIREDENTVLIDGVEYKKVEKPKPPTLLEIIREWNDDDDDPPCEVLVDMISDAWIPDEYQSYSEHNEGWNECLRTIKENLK